jgi:hypothetical protein
MTPGHEIVLIDYGRPLAARRDARRFCGPYRWRVPELRRRGDDPGRGFYTASNGLAMAPRGSTLALRLEDANNHLTGYPSCIRGYYVDLCCHETLKPIIARLPRGRGFLAGWTMGAGMCASLSGFTHQDEREAALAAHEEARCAAELMQEDDEAYQASLDDEEGDDL